MVVTLMNRLMLFFVILFVAANTSAQTRPAPVVRPYTGVGLGVGVAPYPLGYGFWPWWGFPGGYNGFYSNGFSMYGPPIPTYGPVPGTFGASSQRPDAFRGRIDAFWPTTRSAPLAAPLVVEPFAPRAVRSRIEVQVPDPNAIVMLDGRDPGAVGMSRTFETPPLQVGPLYQFEILARWKDGEQMVERRQSIRFRAGQRVRLNFTGPATNGTPPAKLPEEMDQPLPLPKPRPLPAAEGPVLGEPEQ